METILLSTTGGWEDWMGMLVVITIATVVATVVILVRFVQGNRQTQLLENIEQHERTQAEEDQEAGEVMRGGPRGDGVAPASPAPARAAANGGAQPRSGPSALAQATAQRLAALEERDRWREEEERDRRSSEEDPILQICKDRWDRTRKKAQVLGVKLGVIEGEIDNQEIESELIRKGRVHNRNQRRIDEQWEQFYGLDEFQTYEYVRPSPPPGESRRPAPRRPEEEPQPSGRRQPRRRERAEPQDDRTEPREGYEMTPEQAQAYDRGLADAQAGHPRSPRGVPALHWAYHRGYEAYVPPEPEGEEAAQPQPPRIVVQPQDVEVEAGQTATFTVQAEGEELSYQWEVQSNSGWEQISGATVASYATGELTEDDSGNLYRCQVSNPAGSTTSAIATLAVNPAE